MLGGEYRKYMYFIKKRLLRLIFKFLKKNPATMPMVRYWKFKESISAKVTKNKDGALVMVMEGEDEVLPGFPRGHLLFGSLSKIKHEIKNQIFNESWRFLEEGKSNKEVSDYIKLTIDKIAEMIEPSRYDMAPYTKMVVSVRELWRALTVLEEKYKSKRIKTLKEALTYILQEDDAYRFRVQWIIQIFNPSSWWFRLFFRDPIKDFELALNEIEHAEIIGDMKDKVKLLRRILLVFLEDPHIKLLFKEFCKEVNWNKLKLSKADKYFFRGKYFKVDFILFEY